MGIALHMANYLLNGEVKIGKEIQTLGFVSVRYGEKFKLIQLFRSSIPKISVLIKIGEFTETNALL